jgi:pyridoxal phosphate enzyme (YggS family)
MDMISRYAQVQHRLAASRKDAPLAAPSTTLIAVSKTFPAEAVLPLLQTGHRAFGENRVQEMAEKWSPLREMFPDIEMHLIGPLQRNKAELALEHAEVMHSLDRPELAQKLADLWEIPGRRTTRLFVQVNTGEEPQKSGIAPKDTAEFVRWCREDLGLPVEGLMCIPPLDAIPAPHFAWLRAQADRLELPHCSMGMSDDFEQAARFGSTHIRVGSAIFGGR